MSGETTTLPRDPHRERRIPTVHRATSFGLVSSPFHIDWGGMVSRKVGRLGSELVRLQFSVIIVEERPRKWN